MKIKVNPHNVEIIREQTEPINEKEIKVSKCEFEFDDKITNDFVKEAYFTLNGETYKQIIQNNECEYPSEVLEKKGTLEIGVVAYKVENEQKIVRYNPSPDYFESWVGSLKDAENTEPITPTDKEQMEQALQDGLNDINDKIDEVDEKLDGIDTAIEETNNLNLDVSDKVDGDVTITLTKKDASTKTIVLSDGTSLEFNWDGTKLGIKTSDEEEYTYVDLQGIQGPAGPQGEAFRIKKTYPSVVEMNADFNNMEYGDYVMIASSVEVEDNAKLYTRGETQWIFITDFSGATGIRGPVGATPSIQIGTVVSGSTPSVTRTGTDENPVLNFVLQKGDKGDKGNIGDTGNGISSIEKTSTSGLVDTYTITYTNGNTTTFDVTNGKGIDRIEKTATVGNIDTYTIYFNDNSTSTFEVANGEVTKEELQEEVDRLSMIYNLFPTTSDEDTEMTLDGTGEVKLKKIGLKGNTSQTGTPTPDSPQPIHSVSGDNEVVVCGKNLLNPSKFNATTEIPSINSETSVIDINTNNVGSFRKIFDNLELPIGNYSICCIKVSGDYTGGNLCIYDLNGTKYSSEFNIINRVDRFLNINASNGIGRLEIYSPKCSSNTKLQIWIVGGSPTTMPNYEPYQGKDYPIYLGGNVFKLSDIEENKAIVGTTGVINNSSVSNLSGYIPVIENLTYRITFDYTTLLNDTDRGICYYDNSKQFVSGGNLPMTNKNQVITIPSGIRYVRFSYDRNLTNINFSTDTTPIELCKIGNYQDYFYKDSGKWYKYSAIGKVVLDGSEVWTKHGSIASWFYYDGITNGYLDNTSSNTAKSNYYKQQPYSSVTSLVNGEFAYGTSDGGTTKRLVIKNTDYNNASDFMNWLSTHNTEVYYILSTPTTTEITDTTLIEQLDNLEKAYSYDTQTNISQTNDDMPFILDVEALMSLRNVLEI